MTAQSDGGDSRLSRAISEIVGRRNTITDPALRASYETDWTGGFGGPARLVVRPADEAEVVAVLRICSEHGAAVIVQGGNTGLVGGGVPRGGEVVLSTTRLNDCAPVDLAAQRIAVGAGVTLATVQTKAAEAGLEFPLDFGARDSATVGGMISTDAGGVRVLRHGTMGARVDAVRLATIDGSLIGRVDGPLKDTAGYPITRLAVGTEGTLGVITGARLRLSTPPRHRAVALFGLADLEATIALLGVLRRDLGTLESAELFLDDSLLIVLDHLGRRRPIEPAAAYLLVECGADSDPLPMLAEAIEGAAEPLDVAVADDTAGRHALWDLRDRIPVALGELGFVAKYDVAVDVVDVPALIESVREVIVKTGLDPGAFHPFGHLAEGNLHLNVVLDSKQAVPAELSERVLGAVAELGGSISAEHGIGVAKRPWLGLTRSEAEISLMEAVKTGLDPAGLLNPGAVLPDRRG
jgi:FAD/FMN-containing dehydrogenase